jgi:hypothetical protein
LIPVTLFKVFFAFFLTYRAVVEYEYFHLPELAIFLFSARKKYFARRMLVLTYFLAATMKLSESWIVGSYFSSLELGLPAFPNAWIPYITNATVLFEIFTPVLLLSERRKVRLFAIAAWTLFHIYSVSLVGFPYPAHCITLLFALFLPWDSEPRPRFTGRAAVGWGLLATIGIMSALPWFVNGDRLYTVQARKFGAQMFDANHQCISTETTNFRDGHQAVSQHRSSFAMWRCSPYEWLFGIQQRCKKSDIATISWQFDSSINGGPFYRIVDTQDACRLTYNEFQVNDWIRGPEDGALAVGFPRKNGLRGYRQDPIRAVLFDAPDSSLQVASQDFFTVHFQFLKHLYWFLWIGMAAVLLKPAKWHP